MVHEIDIKSTSNFEYFFECFRRQDIEWMLPCHSGYEDLTHESLGRRVKKAGPGGRSGWQVRVAGQGRGLTDSTVRHAATWMIVMLTDLLIGGSKSLTPSAVLYQGSHPSRAIAFERSAQSSQTKAPLVKTVFCFLVLPYNKIHLSELLLESIQRIIIHGGSNMRFEPWTFRSTVRRSSRYTTVTL